MNKKKIPPTPLSELEHTLLWMSIRYACGRKTIAGASLPTEIVEKWWHRISDDQKRGLYRDLKWELDFLTRVGKEKGFGDDCDYRWQKFMSACNVDAYEEVTLTDGTTEIIFRANDKIYPLGDYIKTPWADIFIPKDKIKKGE